MRKNWVGMFILVGFLIIINIPLFGIFVSPERQFVAGNIFEGGFSFQQMLKKYLTYPVEFCSYFQNHHFTYKWQVNLFHLMRYHVFHETVFPNVLIGKEDWLYYTGENNIDDYQCTSPFTADELDTIRHKLEGWDQQLKERGIQFYFVIAPNKETIYPQYLPDRIQPLPRRCRIDQVMQVLEDSPLPVLDLRTAMQTAAQTNQVYHRTDTHWNALGALQASSEILAMLNDDFSEMTTPSLADYHQQIESFSGDLAAFLPKDDRFIEQTTQLILIHSSGVEIRQGEGRNIFSTIAGSNLPRAVIFRDSFIDALVPFLSDHFSRVVYEFSFTVDMDIMDEEKPDIVILEIAQRYLTMLR